MGMLSDFFIAAGADAATGYECSLLDEDEDRRKAFHAREYKGFTGLEVGRLHALLARQPFSLAEHMPEVVSSERHEGITQALPDEFRDALADMQAGQIKDLAAKWAAEMMEEIEFDPAFLETMLPDLRDLAQSARNAGKGLYLWTNT